ncbi:MAG: starch phosphorylase [Pseudohongiellaceae bacterium]|jgi:starch phosphorylase
MGNETSTTDSIAFRKEILRHVCHSLGKEWLQLSGRELLQAVSLAVRDAITERMIATEQRVRDSDGKRVYYLSMEFLMGRSLGNNLLNMGLEDVCRKALWELGVDLDDVAAGEADAALGNGGLGRLAACFLDSAASLDISCWGYGINYEFGLFRQEIHDGWQKERPDSWMDGGTPWQIAHNEDAVLIPAYGHLEKITRYDGEEVSTWMNWKVLVGVPHDMPVVGYGGRTVNRLRLYSARASNEFDMDIFNAGDYSKAVAAKMSSETISKVLYPPDDQDSGRELRLLQEYFFTACAIQDIIQRHLAAYGHLDNLSSKVAIQLNDTHPALAVAELMRVLIDEHGHEWDKAWSTTQATLAYTNHTLLPEALETWSLDTMRRVLPRHLSLIEEIDRRFTKIVSKRWPLDERRAANTAIIRDGVVRMANLAVVGSHSVNGVAELHSGLVKTKLLPDFYDLWPERFNNKTNGITQRRWLASANPELAALATEVAGPGWITDLDQLRALESMVDDTGFRDRFADIKQLNKTRLADIVKRDTGIIVDPLAMFDVQAKRIHEYKRQLLFAMFIIHEYLSIVEEGVLPLAPRTYIISGKAAPGYWAAKQIIKLINSIADVVNNDPRASDMMRVVFLPDYRVSLAERVFPGADLSEQISTAGMEASGTGNMKFALNGALTMGTLDGANVEILEEVGEENIFIFGLRCQDVERMRQMGNYDPHAVYESSPTVRRVVDSFSDGRWSPEEPKRFHWLAESLLTGGDYYFHLADLEPYIVTQQAASRVFLDPSDWWTRSILNVARMGKFSSDRTIRQYAKDIWGVSPVNSGSAPPLSV